jgi:hypothetical protein
MYLVSFAEFKQFLSQEKINDHAVLPGQPPFILQFIRDEKVMGKIEVVNIDAYKWNEKYGFKSFRKSENKYWIRGKEWYRPKNAL